MDEKTKIEFGAYMQVKEAQDAFIEFSYKMSGDYDEFKAYMYAIADNMRKAADFMAAIAGPGNEG